MNTETINPLNKCNFFTRIFQLNRFTWKSPNSLVAILSYFSFLSVISIASPVSFLSIGSIGSVASIFSTGSVASLFSVGCIGKIYTDCTKEPYIESAASDIPVKIVLYSSIIFALHTLITSEMYWAYITKNSRLITLKVVYTFTSIIYIATVILLITSSFMFDGGAIFVALGVWFSASADPKRSWFWYFSLKGLCLFGAGQILAGACWIGEYQWLATLSTLSICLCIIMHISFVDVKISPIPTGPKSLGLDWVVKISATAVCFIFAFLFLALWRYEQPNIGTVLADPLCQYGIGPEKRWVVFNLTYDSVYDNRGLNEWSNLHSDDKKFAKLRVYGEDSLVSSEKYIGIERKGQNWRNVPNLNFAMIKNSIENNTLVGTDDDVELYQSLGDDYEDYWMSFGARGDITHARQLFAAKIDNAPNVLVEVLTELNGIYYYEGIGFLTPAHKRKFNKNIFGFDGKVKCNDEGTFEDSTGPYLIALNTPPKVSFVSDLAKREDSDEKWKYIYPKKETIETKCNDNNRLDVLETYDIITNLIESDKSLSLESIDLPSFIRTRVYESILQDTDFPYRSQEYVYHNNRLYSGMLWDFNSISHMYYDPQGKLDMINVYATYGYDKPMGLWKSFCFSQSEIFKENSDILYNALNISRSSIHYVEILLSDKNTVQAFGRTMKRNKLYGTQQGNGLDISTDWRNNYVLEPNFLRERDVQVLRLKDRINTIEIRKNENCQLIEKHRGRLIMAFLGISLIAWCIILSACCCDFIGRDIKEDIDCNSNIRETSQFQGLFSKLSPEEQLLFLRWLEDSKI